MDKDRKQVEYEVVQRILEALNSGEVTYREAQEISKYFLLHFTAGTDALTFLNNINAKWKVFGPMLEKYQKQSKYSQEDTVKLDKIKEQLSKLTQTKNG